MTAAVKWSDSFFFELLDKSLNNLPASQTPLFEMREQEINSWLEKPNFKEEKQQWYKITIPPEFCKKNAIYRKICNKPSSIP